METGSLLVGFLAGLFLGILSVVAWISGALRDGADQSDRAVGFWQRGQQLFNLATTVQERSTYMAGMARADIARRRELADYERFVNRRIDYYVRIAAAEGRELPPWRP